MSSKSIVSLDRPFGELPLPPEIKVRLQRLSCTDVQSLLSDQTDQANSRYRQFRYYVKCAFDVSELDVIRDAILLYSDVEVYGFHPKSVDAHP